MKKQARTRKTNDTPATSLTVAARALGVTRTHLSLVKHGHRISARLCARYYTLTGQTLRAA